MAATGCSNIIVRSVVHRVSEPDRLGTAATPVTIIIWLQLQRLKEAGSAAMAPAPTVFKSLISLKNLHTLRVKKM